VGVFCKEGKICGGGRPPLCCVRELKGERGQGPVARGQGSGVRMKNSKFKIQNSFGVKLQGTHRRGKFRRNGILITSHKRSAVWGTEKTRLQRAESTPLKEIIQEITINNIKKQQKWKTTV